MTTPDPKLEELFGRAVDLPPAGRQRLIAQECANDPMMRARLERLLIAHDGAEQLLPAPSSQDASPSSATLLADPLLGQSVGMFRINRLLGVGGMGSVYLATQESPRRQVALKVMRPSLVAKGAAQRFRVEAEALGALSHEHIARIYEAGVALTPVGRVPYFAMEFIEGRSLLDFATQQQLPIPARLQLLATIADAVEHAHRRGVVHRDLKPANILVTTAGEPKVLDFGVARLTSQDLPAASLHTEAGQLLGTLQYMSPEQASGDPNAIDTRSDVYSLGVILYELLSGQLPYDVSTSTLLQAAAIIREREPKSLGDFHPALRGDVETIVHKSIEKNANARYQSAAELAADLRRFLSDQPITARAPTATYYLRKFVRRNRALSLAVVGVLVSLLLGLVGTTIGLRRAVDAQVLADLNAAKSEINEYGANINAAFASLRAGDLATARARLDAADPKFRAWEWQYAKAQLDQSCRTLRTGNGNFVAGLALSPDEALLACVADDRLEIYDLATGALLRSRSPKALAEYNFGQIAWSPDGTRLLASLTYSKSAVILDAATLDPVLTLDGMKREVTDVAWSPDGTRAAICEGHWMAKEPGDRICTIRNTKSGTIERVLRDLPWRADLKTAWAPDGHALLVATQKGTVIFDCSDWSRRIAPSNATAARDGFAAWSPDSNRFIVSRNDALCIYDAHTLDARWSMPILHGKAGQVTYAAGGTQLVVALNDGLTVLDANTGALRHSLRGVKGSVNQLAASARRSVVWSGDSSGAVREWSLDAVGDVLEVQARDNATPAADFSFVIHSCPIVGQDGTGPMTVRDGRTGTPLREFQLGDSVDAGSEVAITPDKRFVVRAQVGPFLSVFDLQSGEHWERPLAAFPGRGTLACTPDSQFILYSANASLRTFSLPTLEPSTRWQFDGTPPSESAFEPHLAIAPDGTSVVLNTDLGSISILRQGSPTPTRLRVLDNSLRGMTFSPDSRWFAVADNSGALALLDTSTWRVVARFGRLSTGPVELCFDPTASRLFVPQLDGTIRILGRFTLPDSPDPKLIEVGSLHAGDYWMMRVRMSTDGTRLLAATAWPANRYFIWDARPQSALFVPAPPNDAASNSSR